MQTISQILAQELNCKQEYIENVIALLDEGNTIPFIARYRKEQHGAMDDTALRTLETRLQYLRNLAQRREDNQYNPIHILLFLILDCKINKMPGAFTLHLIRNDSVRVSSILLFLI